MKIVVMALILLLPVLASAQTKLQIRSMPRAVIQKMNLKPAEQSRLSDSSCSEAVRNLCGKASEKEGGIAGCVQLNKKKLDEYCSPSKVSSESHPEPKVEQSESKMFSLGVAAGAGKTKEIKGNFPDGDNDYFAVRLKGQGSFWMINPNFTFYKVGRDKPSVRTINIGAYIGPLVVHEVTFRDQGRTHFERLMGGLGKDFKFGDKTHVIASIGAARFGTDFGGVRTGRVRTKGGEENSSGGFVGADFETKVWILNMRLRQSVSRVKSETFSNTLAHVDLMPITLWKLHVGPEFEFIDSRVVGFREQIVRAGIAINY